MTNHESASIAAPAILLALFLAVAAPAETLRLESSALRVEIDAKTGRWSLLDKAANVRWPSAGSAGAGAGKGLEGGFRHEAAGPNTVRLVASGGAVVAFELVDERRSVVLRYEGTKPGELRVLEDALSVTDAEKGAIVVPCREGLLIPADSGAAFQQTFGTSEYEGCHMNMLGFLKDGGALAVTWDDAYVWPEIKSAVHRDQTPRQQIATAFVLRHQNLPEIQRLFVPRSYFIDTTYAVGPRECFDPKHPIGRNDDIAWKKRLSDEARKLFGLFGSECGREWALPHSDFFEGLVGVAGKPFHNLKPESLGARVIPFWETVYHDCQACYGKYEYAADQAAEYVVHHVLCARPLHYHEIPDHCYWREKPNSTKPSGPQACFTRTDHGWGEPLHPTDAFLKTTHEVLGPLHESTAHERLRRFEFLAADRSLQRAVYGQGENATTVIVNFGKQDAKVQSRFGGEVLLPPWGFVIDAPRLAAFYAKRWNGQDYPDAALFTLQAVDGKRLSAAARVRVFHGFGDPKIVWCGSTHEIRREAVIGTDQAAR